MFYRSECNVVGRADESDRSQQNGGRRKDEGQLLKPRDWSSPAKGATLAAPTAAAAVTTPSASSLQSSSSQRSSRAQLPVPVPVYCEPLTTTDSTMKVIPLCWNALIVICIFRLIFIFFICMYFFVFFPGILCKGCARKNDSTCFCQNFLKSPPNLILFGTRTVKAI